jgi:hypothetical protein
MPKRKRYFYDTEFIEDGHTVDLISIGMVDEDGREFYAISNVFNVPHMLHNEWLMENVFPSLPLTIIKPGIWKWDNSHPDYKYVMDRKKIKEALLDFVSGTWPEFWAWYGAYDHVALCQLFGKMIDLPDNFPMFTCDIKQEQKRLGISRELMPVQEEGKHNALADARFNKQMFEHLRSFPFADW